MDLTNKKKISKNWTRSQQSQPTHYHGGVGSSIAKTKHHLGESFSNKKDPLCAEGVLYDLNKLQMSLFNQKRRKDVDPVLVQRHTKRYPDNLKKSKRKS